MVDISLTNTCTCNVSCKHTVDKVPEQEKQQKVEPKKVGHSYLEVKKRNSFFNKR